MIEIRGKIPLSIHPLFWVTSGLIGFSFTRNLLATLVWVAIVLISVVIHELGHALTAVLFRQKARIDLVALGGLTSYQGPKLRFWQQFLITLNGPLFGFFLFLLASFLIESNWLVTPFWLFFWKSMQAANLFWTIINLLPVLPMDGGQLLRIVLEGFLGVKGFKIALLSSSIIALLFSLGFFVLQQILVGSLFFLFAFESFDAWRKSRHAIALDRDEKIAIFLQKGEMALRSKKLEEARAIFEKICEKSKEGVFFSLAAYNLSLVDVEEGKNKEAYLRLVPIESFLSDEAKALLHHLAAIEKDFETVARLSDISYQLHPTQEVALRNARAFAHLKKARFAGGWLQTAIEFGGLDPLKLLEEKEFFQLKQDPEFMPFIKNYL